MGFAKPLDADDVPLFFPGALAYAWGGAVNAMAAGLGVLDDVTQTTERRAVDFDFEVASGPVPAGTTAAMRFEVQGIVGGEARIVAEHITRLHNDAAPDWPASIGDGHYDVLIEGSPRIECTLRLLGEHDGDHNTGGVLATVMRLLNAVPAVCAAEPGILSLIDLPLGSGLHIMRP